MFSPIKYKAKTLVDNNWVEGYFVKFDKDGAGIILPESVPLSISLIFVDEDTVCQSTGETDVDGRELFIGDMINDFGGGTYVENRQTGLMEIQGDTTRHGIIVFEDGTTRIRTKEMSYSYNLSKGVLLSKMKFVSNIFD